jgi:hypothetical protein
LIAQPWAVVKPIITTILLPYPTVPSVEHWVTLDVSAPPERLP